MTQGPDIPGEISPGWNSPAGNSTSYAVGYWIGLGLKYACVLGMFLILAGLVWQNQVRLHDVQQQLKEMRHEQVID